MKSFIYIETSEEGIDSTARQIASRISKISKEVRGPLTGISIGHPLVGEDFGLSGFIDDMIQVEIPSEYQFNTEVISKILTEIVSENKPCILFLGFTHQGMELGPGIGWELMTPVFTNCVDLEWTERQINIKRPIQGGKLVASLTVDLKRGAIISVQKGAWKEVKDGDEREKPVSVNRLMWREGWSPQKTNVLRIIKDTIEGEDDITKAEILVSVGRGVGDPENLPIMKKLAEELKGMISCSRPVVDLGWLPASRQVGISGRTVTPVVYLALGISGQANHIAGMDTSKIIIAVNKDPLAPIFTIAHYGIVDDILQFVPELIRQIEEQ
jgi:electron transfer flavoprotein alpha subunit